MGPPRWCHEHVFSRRQPVLLCGAWNGLLHDCWNRWEKRRKGPEWPPSPKEAGLSPRTTRPWCTNSCPSCASTLAGPSFFGPPVCHDLFILHACTTELDVESQTFAIWLKANLCSQAHLHVKAHHRLLTVWALRRNNLPSALVPGRTGL